MRLSHGIEVNVNVGKRGTVSSSQGFFEPRFLEAGVPRKRSFSKKGLHIEKGFTRELPKKGSKSSFMPLHPL